MFLTEALQLKEQKYKYDKKNFTMLIFFNNPAYMCTYIVICSLQITTSNSFVSTQIHNNSSLLYKDIL